MDTKIKIIACIDDKRAIGKDGGIPWHLPEDLKRFKRLTKGQAVVMGRKTFESIGQTLTGRMNVIISSSLSVEGAINHRSLIEGIYSVKSHFSIIWIIGGESIYRESLGNPKIEINEVHLSRIAGDFKGDRFFPEFEGEVIHSEKSINHTYEIWKPCTTARDVKKS